MLGLSFMSCWSCCFQNTATSFTAYFSKVARARWAKQGLRDFGILFLSMKKYCTATQIDTSLCHSATSYTDTMMLIYGLFLKLYFGNTFPLEQMATVRLSFTISLWFLMVCFSNTIVKKNPFILYRYYIYIHTQTLHYFNPHT